VDGLPAEQCPGAGRVAEKDGPIARVLGARSRTEGGSAAAHLGGDRREIEQRVALPAGEVDRRRERRDGCQARDRVGGIVDVQVVAYLPARRQLDRAALRSRP
jgi:hypothetical protein